MSEHPAQNPTRRELLAGTGAALGASALAGITLPPVHAAENNTINPLPMDQLVRDLTR